MGLPESTAHSYCTVLLSFLLYALARLSSGESGSEGAICHRIFDVSNRTIIKATESIQNGARYIRVAKAAGRIACQTACCESADCNIVVFEEKASKDMGDCYLFNCGDNDHFKCKFAIHDNYVSMGMIVNRADLEKTKINDKDKHEMDLTLLRVGDADAGKPKAGDDDSSRNANDNSRSSYNGDDAGNSNKNSVDKSSYNNYNGDFVNNFGQDGTTAAKPVERPPVQNVKNPDSRASSWYPDGSSNLPVPSKNRAAELNSGIGEPKKLFSGDIGKPQSPFVDNSSPPLFPQDTRKLGSVYPSRSFPVSENSNSGLASYYSPPQSGPLPPVRRPDIGGSPSTYSRPDWSSAKTDYLDRKFPVPPAVDRRDPDGLIRRRPTLPEPPMSLRRDPMNSGFGSDYGSGSDYRGIKRNPVSGNSKPASPCNEYQWQCGSGDCIAQYDVCDGIPQCTDKSDESNCPRAGDSKTRGKSFGANGKPIAEHSSHVRLEPPEPDDDRSGKLGYDSNQDYKSSRVDNDYAAAGDSRNRYDSSMGYGDSRDKMGPSSYGYGKNGPSGANRAAGPGIPDINSRNQQQNMLSGGPGGGGRYGFVDDDDDGGYPVRNGGPDRGDGYQPPDWASKSRFGQLSPEDQDRDYDFDDDEDPDSSMGRGNGFLPLVKGNRQRQRTSNDESISDVQVHSNDVYQVGDDRSYGSSSAGDDDDRAGAGGNYGGDFTRNRNDRHSS